MKTLKDWQKPELNYKDIITLKEEIFAERDAKIEEVLNSRSNRADIYQCIGG